MLPVDKCQDLDICLGKDNTQRERRDFGKGKGVGNSEERKGKDIKTLRRRDRKETREKKINCCLNACSVLTLLGTLCATLTPHEQAL